MTNKENPPELVQHFAYGGSSHRCKGAARYSIVWLYRSPYPSGKEGGILLVPMKTTCLRGA
jgi:hypothetical protein